MAPVDLADQAMLFRFGQGGRLPHHAANAVRLTSRRAHGKKQGSQWRPTHGRGMSPERACQHRPYRAAVSWAQESENKLRMRDLLSNCEPFSGLQ